MKSLLGISNVRTEFFSFGNNEFGNIKFLQDEINAFLAEHDQQIIDIRMSTRNEALDVMVIYQPLA